MITVDGREIKFKSKTREETVKVIIDAINKDYLSDEVIHHIQLICVVGACEKQGAEFHCGVEESGFHAYNCNDCPNKCEEYYQWDKEMKK